MAVDKQTLAQMKDRAKDLVIQSRAGDQNAMAQIAEVRKAAEAGGERASLAFNLLKDYIRIHPVDSASFAVFAGEADILKGDFHKNVETIVKHARQGDDWAQKLLASIKQGAERGRARARLLWHAFRFYLKENSIFGAEISSQTEVDISRPESGFRLIPCRDGIECLVVCFANGPLLKRGRLVQLASSFPQDKESQLFQWGVSNPGDESVLNLPIPNRAKACTIVGQCVGKARGIQSARAGHAPLSVFCPDVARELGEQS
jgi:hypothetical protein